MLWTIGTMAQEHRPGPGELEDLLLQIAAGGREVLADFYAATRTAVYGLALSYLKNGHDAEDVVQDTYIRVWDSAAGYQPHGKPMAWVLTIAKNFSLMHLRSREKMRDLSEGAWESLAIEAPAVTAEDRQVLSAALEVLGEQERQIVLLHAVSGLKHREIAQLMELPLATVLSKYHRGLKKLRGRLEGGDAI